MNDYYTIFYLVTNVLGTYIIFRYYNIFFKNRKRKGFKYNIVMAIAYYLIISFVHLYFNNSTLTLVTNIILFYFISLLYENTFKKRIISVLLIYLVLLLSECISVLIIILFSSKNDVILGFVLSQIVSIILLTILNRRYFLKEEILIPKLQTTAILVFPIGSIILFYSSINFAPERVVLIDLTVLLTFIILIYYIFDAMNKSYLTILNNKIEYSNKILEMQMYEQEKESYSNQFAILKEKQDQIDTLKHDLKNHIIGLHNLLDNGNNEEFKKYLERMKIEESQSVIDTGNIVLDSIINYKLTQAIKKNIKVELDVKIPSNLNIESFDINVIFGNLLQNAIEALEQCPTDNRFLQIIMNYKLSCLYINIQNSYSHELKIIDDLSFLSTKENAERHGIGLESVKRSIVRYDGDISIETKDNLFSVDILLYVK